MLRGFATVSFYADDMEAAKRWYTEMLGFGPYFERSGPDGAPAYMEFRVGDYQHELGVIDSRYAAHRTGEPAGAVIFWAVDDLEAEVERLISLGATEHEKITERGPGFVTASVVDPFGNILGVMYNQHYLDVLGAAGKG